MSIPFKSPKTVSIAQAIGFVTFLEIMRDKVLYNILFCTSLLFGLSYLASQLTYGQPVRIILDFGLLTVTLSCLMIALLTGSSLLAKEFQQRTISIALCRPITHFQFIMGKFFGLVAVLVINWFILSAIYLLMLYCTATLEDAVFSLTLFQALGFCFLQSLCIASIALFFSSFSTTSLTVMMTLGVYFIGNNISQIQMLIQKIQAPFWRGMFGHIVACHPNFEHFAWETQVTYQILVSWNWIYTGILYSGLMTVFFLGLAGILMKTREVL